MTVLREMSTDKGGKKHPKTPTNNLINISKTIIPTTRSKSIYCTDKVMKCATFSSLTDGLLNKPLLSFTLRSYKLCYYSVWVWYKHGEGGSHYRVVQLDSDNHLDEVSNLYPPHYSMVKLISTSASNVWHWWASKNFCMDVGASVCLCMRKASFQFIWFRVWH